jgi:DNA-binding response OmpR family regulator
MMNEAPRCTVCGKPVFPTAPTMFRTAQYTTHPRCIRVPRSARSPRKDHAAAGPEAEGDVQAPGSSARWKLDEAITYLGALLTDVSVLIVAQRDVVGEALRRFFRSLGAIALPAGSVDQAVGLVEAARPELVVCDVSLLAFEERSLIRRIRNQSSGGGPIVLGIGTTPAERAIAESAGVDAYVPKPIGYGELAEALQRVDWQRADWVHRQQDRIRRRGEFLRAQAARKRVNAEVARLNAQAVITKAETLAARANASSGPFPLRDARARRPRYRPRLLGD